MSAKRIIWLVFVALPFACFGMGMAIGHLIPNCTIDTGIGASPACGTIGPFLVLMVFGGFVFGVLGLLTAPILQYLAERSDANDRAPRIHRDPVGPKTVIDGSTIVAFRRTFGELQAGLTEAQRSLLRDKLKRLSESRLSNEAAGHSTEAGYSAESLRGLLNGLRYSAILELPEAEADSRA